MSLEIPEGYELEVTHLRLTTDPEGNEKGLTIVSDARKLNRVIAPRGGRTMAKIIHPSKFRIVASGEAICSPDDNYNRKIGYNIAVGRALKEFNEASHS